MVHFSKITPLANFIPAYSLYLGLQIYKLEVGGSRLVNDTTGINCSQYRGKMSLDSMILLGTILSGIAYGASS